jgi:hypothetical protein
MIISNFKSSAAATVIAVAGFGMAAPAFATTVNTISNVVFIVDESGSMAGEQAFLQSVIEDLDAALATEGVTNRSYGVVGFGGPNNGNPRTMTTGAPALADATQTKADLGTLVVNGGTEDGFEAINYALTAFNYVAGAAINYILVTDEDRDVTSSDTFASVLASLQRRNILLNAIVNNPFTSDNFTAASVLGINDSGEAYIADGSGGFTTDTGAVVGNGDGTTETDYVAMALQTGGAAWNLNLLRAGGLTADSFAKSFIDIKVGEITTQPPSGPTPVPLPAGAWLLLGGLGALAATRRKKAA